MVKMDLILDLEDKYFFNWMYSKLSPDYLALNASDPVRQFISIYLTLTVHGWLLYFIGAGLSWFLFFDKKYLEHPKKLDNQVMREISTTFFSIPIMSVYTSPIFWLEVNGYSKLLDSSPGWQYELSTIFSFLVFTDFCIYWIHRWLHHPLIYPHVHKTHHLWKVPTPWASHAFHPLDGFLQSTPYHMYAFLFPMNKVLYLGMFIFVNMWTISIHDGWFVSFDGVINSSAHHAEHHLHFTCNYGQYFTFWDRMFGSHRYPDHESLDPVNAIAKKNDAMRRAQKTDKAG
uniref:Fatty acid hydroxylase domain-containing protein n=1 Tax=Hanusia phi TaxID=3032 RepID=A0A7S0HMC8_9CRYP